MANRRNPNTQQPVVSAQPAVEAEPSPLADLICAVTVGIDIGFGVTKAVTHTGKSVLFPSVCGVAREFKFQGEKITEKHPGDQLTDEDGNWFVGDLALRQLRPDEILKLRARASNDVGNAFRVRMMKAALGKLLPGLRNGADVVHVRLATGLPVDHMPDAGKLKAALLGQHIIHTDQTKFIANVVEVMVMPQPYGTIYSKQILPTGQLDPSYIYTLTGVIDTGTYSVDFAVDDDGEYISQYSGSIEAGVYTIQEKIAVHLEDTYKQKFPLHDIEKVLRAKKLNIAGKPVDFTKTVDEYIGQMADGVVMKAADLWKEAGRLDVIWLSGGGAALVEKAILSVYPQAQLVKSAQTANAQGYCNYAMFAANPDC